jgi:hypothetical protein
MTRSMRWILACAATLLLHAAGSSVSALASHAGRQTSQALLVTPVANATAQQAVLAYSLPQPPTGPVLVAARCAARAEAADPIVSYTYDPIVVRVGVTTAVSLTVKTDGTVTALAAELESGPTLTATALPANTFRLVFSSAQVLHQYVEGYGHNAYGRLAIYVGASLYGRLNLSVNVMDAAVPSVVPVDLAYDARAGPHVVNLRRPSASLGSFDSATTSRFYELYADSFDFISLVYADSHTQNRSHAQVSNHIQGIGVRIFDAVRTYGSQGRLAGITVFPISTFFDGAEDGFQHELGHQWINFVLPDGSPHWPISELAQGLMGISLAGGQGGQFPFTFAPNPDGTYTLHSRWNLHWEIGFTDLDLYLMGLLPAAQVRPALVFSDQNQADQIREDGVLHGPTYNVDANYIVARHGSRVPDAGGAPKQFRIATIVITRDRLLTADELTFFDYMASRASLTQPVPYSVGLTRGTARPFFLTTRGLGTLIADMAPLAEATPTHTAPATRTATPTRTRTATPTATCTRTPTRSPTARPPGARRAYLPTLVRQGS